MHINKININGIWVSYDIENVKSIQNGIKKEDVQAVASFIKDGEVIHKIYKIGNFDYCAKLLDMEFGKSEAIRMIESANKSKHSPFK